MTVLSEIALAVLGPLARLVVDLVEGKVRNPEDAARAVLGIALDAVPVEDLREYLDDEARKRQDLAYEASKRLKWPAP